MFRVIFPKDPQSKEEVQKMMFGDKEYHICNVFIEAWKIFTDSSDCEEALPKEIKIKTIEIAEIIFKMIEHQRPKIELNDTAKIGIKMKADAAHIIVESYSVRKRTDIVYNEIENRANDLKYDIARYRRKLPDRGIYTFDFKKTIYTSVPSKKMSGLSRSDVIDILITSGIFNNLPHTYNRYV